MSNSLKALLTVCFCGCAVLMVLGFGRWGQALVHGNSHGCYLNLYQNLTTEARALITGSSRIRRSDLSGAVADATGSEVHLIGDLSHPGVKLHFDFALADRFSERQDIDLLVYEIWPEGAALRAELAEQNSAEPYNFGAREIEYINGTPLRILARHLWSQDEPLLLRGWELMNALSTRAAYAASLVTEPRRVVRLRNTQQGLRENWTGSDCFLAAWEDETDRMQLGNAKGQALKVEHRDRFTTWTDPQPTGFFEDPDFAGERDVLHKVVSLGNTRGFATVFVYLPEIYVPIDAAGLSSSFLDTFGAPLLVPPPEVRAKLNADTYTDSSHPNNQGRAILQAWLASALPDAIAAEAQP